MPMTKRALENLAVIAALSILASCGGGPETETYPRTSVRTLTRGRPPASAGFRYALVNPSIESLYRNVGLVRDGNVVEFITGRNLEEKLAGRSGGVELFVVKEFSPFVHFRVERVYAAQDTAFLTPGAVFLPRVIDANAFSMTPYERADIDDAFADRTGALRGLENRKIRFSCRITEERGEGGAHFVLHGRSARLRVAAVQDGIGVVLRLLAEKGYPFEGGVVVTATEEAGSRSTSGVAGTVEVEWVKYGRRVVSE